MTWDSVETPKTKKLKLFNVYINLSCDFEY